MSKKYLFAFAGLYAFIVSDFANANCVRECNAAIGKAEHALEHLAGGEVRVIIPEFTRFGSRSGSSNHKNMDCVDFCKIK